MSVFGDFGRRVMKARQRQAERHVAATLLGFNDEVISQAGHTRAELERKAKGYPVYL